MKRDETNRDLLLKPYLSVKEIAIVLDKSEATVRRSLQKKSIPKCEFGLLTTEVIKQFDLSDYFKMLITSQS